jgi:hypothetical protein
MFIVPKGRISQADNFVKKGLWEGRDVFTLDLRMLVLTINKMRRILREQESNLVFTFLVSSLSW